MSTVRLAIKQNGPCSTYTSTTTVIVTTQGQGVEHAISQKYQAGLVLFHHYVCLRIKRLEKKLREHENPG